MQPIIVILLIGVAAVTLSTGALMPEINWFNLQGVSVNERDFSAPLSHVNVDIEISKISKFITDASGNRHNAFFNVINECSFHTPDPGGLGPGSTVICKLSDFQGDVVAEGREDFTFGLAKSERTIILIDQTAFSLANEVQNINDIKLIVLGGDPTAHICNQLMNDICIDFDGAQGTGGTAGRGLDQQDINTFIGAPLLPLTGDGTVENIDWFDSDGDGVHDVGWDALSIDTSQGLCATQNTPANDDNDVYDQTNPTPDNRDCAIIDISSMLQNGDAASVDITDGEDFDLSNPFPTFWFHDADGDGGYDAGEDIFISADDVLD